LKAAVQAETIEVGLDRIDIFMDSLLDALVAFGLVIATEPGVGALAFCAVVILTMLAVETFDPRLMWGRRDTAHFLRASAAHGPATDATASMCVIAAGISAEIE
jgi:hypothetical protein